MRYLSGYFKELSKIVNNLGKKHQIQIINAKGTIMVGQKMENLDDNIDLGLNLCKLMRDLDGIGTLTVVFFWLVKNE